MPQVLASRSLNRRTNGTHRFITISGAREHNLKNVSVKLPREKFIVITGISGSGKSSLAFDTLYAEGQRRYVESLSAYARQFLGRMDKPDVDFIDGLSPAIAIDQKSTSHNPRSTVGTVTEIYDYLRLLFARVGTPHCPECGREIGRLSAEQIVDRVLELQAGARVNVIAPIVRGRKGYYSQVFEDIRKQGFVRVRVDGEIRDVSEDIQLDRYKQHWIDVVVDRLIIQSDVRSRLSDSVEQALELGSGLVIVNVADGAEAKGSSRDDLFSEQLACPDCGTSLEEIQPRNFSFNSPYGACPECDGLGNRFEFDPMLVIADDRLSIAEGAILPWRSTTSDYKRQMLKAVALVHEFSVDTPIRDLNQEQLDTLLYGTSEKVQVTYHNRWGRLRTRNRHFEGVIGSLQNEYKEAGADEWSDGLRRYMTRRSCTQCKGARLRPESLSVTIDAPFALQADYAPPFMKNGRRKQRGASSICNIAQTCQLSVADALCFFDKIELSEREQIIGLQILKEIRSRLQFLVNVGLDYLTLDREAATLAGGEAQRIRLATQIGSGLMGVVYILDEPSIGLHARDQKRLLVTLKRLRDLGNTVIVVEHDEETIRAADFIADLGPGAGEEGGHMVAVGTLDDIMSESNSVTGQYLSKALCIEVPKDRRSASGDVLVVKGARQHNLKDIDVRIPLGCLTCITGVSGSGKSTLLNEIIYRRLAHQLHRAATRWGEHDEILGVDKLDKIINIDQAPIGRTPRSNPATYTGTFTPIRDLFSRTREARARGYKPGRFSFNVKGGRCEACQGDGIVKIEMHWLPDVYVPCEVCKGKRYNRETLEVTYKDKTIYEVLDMSVSQALKFFENTPRIRRILQTLEDVGMGYIKLGQQATTLSGGEAQRVKLAEELSRRSTGQTAYILDEPTVGLHFDDVKKLLNVLHRLVDAGNSVIVIEHSIEVIKTADWIIDLGPEGGAKGGEIVAEGTPEDVAKNNDSHTGQFLHKALKGSRRVKAARSRKKVERVRA